MDDHTRPGAGPLAGITVLELGNFIAAPTAGRLLADFGADVIKVERPRTGDELRHWRLHAGDTSLLWRVMARNKKSVTLDLRQPEGQSLALQLAERSDVILENFRPGTLERWGLGPTALKAVNPGVVLVRISGYGQTGPYRDLPGFGGVAEAVGGLRHLTGYPGHPPTRVGISLADSVAGLYGVIGALMGLIQRDRRGNGEVVDIALYEAIYSMMESLVPDYDAFGIVPGPTGSGLPGVAPSNTYRSRDGKYVVISGNGDAIFKRLMVLVGRDDLATDPALADNSGRVASVAELDAVIGDWAAALTQEEILAALQGVSVPCGPIFTAEDIAKDPHFEARGMLENRSVSVEPGRDAEVRFPGIVPKLDTSPGDVRWLGPELGEDTETVLTGLGVDAAELRRLADWGVI